MPSDNTNPEIWKYFKKGDVVKDTDSYWGDKLFVIDCFHGNAYCPELLVFQKGRPRTIRNMCNFDVRSSKLIDANSRPMKRLNKQMLLKLKKSGNVEAEREFFIRVNNKIL